MAKIISLVDFLKEKDSTIEYVDRKFPIFEGKVMGISAELIHKNETTSVLDYLPLGQKLPESNIGDILLKNEDKIKEHKEKCNGVIKRVLVPFSVNPEIVVESNVKGYISEIEGSPVYILEVLKDKTITDAVKALSSIAGQQFGSKYGGFQYIAPLTD